MQRASRLLARIVALGSALALVGGSPMASSFSPAALAGPAGGTDGILIYADRSEPESLDPAMGVGTSTYMQGHLMYDTIVFQNNSGKIVPLLATSWEMSADGKTYTFKLRRDVEFHSGKKMTSADVKYTYERLKNPRTGSPWNDFMTYVERVDTPDDATVILRLSKPDRLLLENLSHSSTAIVNQATIDRAGRDYGRTVVDGTGPFKLVERVFNDRLVYDRFDKYRWGPAFYQSTGPASVRRVIWRVVPELQSRQLMMEKGEIDLITHNSPTDVMYRAKDLQGRVLITLRPVGETRALFLNMNFPRLRERAVRQAIAHGINAKAIAESIYAPVGKQATNMLHPLSYGYSKETSDNIRKFDPARARAILEEAGWRRGADGMREKGGVALRGIRLMGLPQYRDAATVIREQLADIGIGVDIQLLERGRLYPMRRTGDVEAEFTNTQGTPQMFQELMLSGNFPGTNRFGWKDPKTDQLIETFLAGPDEKQAIAAAAQLQRTAVVDEALFIPIYWTSEINIVNTRTLRNFVSTAWQNVGIGKLLKVTSARQQ
jgi:peptide/nickel transport system substrate-binding protein